MNGYLELSDGAIVAVHDGMVLGRVAACDVVVDDTKASRRHARLIVEAGVVEIEDLGSSNGTLLNGNPVERRMLRDGDEVRIGKTAIVYRAGALPGHGHAAPAASPASGGGGLFDDDDDLLGSSATAPAPSPTPARPQPVEPPPRPVEPAPPAPEPDAAELLAPPPPSTATSSSGPPSSGPPSSGPPSSGPASSGPAASPSAASPPLGRPAVGKVVEFEDEVVEVRTPAAKPAAAARGAGPARGKADEVVAGSQRVLQFSKKAGGKGLLGDDLGQMSAGMRMLLVVVVLAAGVAIVWGVMTAMR